VSEFDDLDDGTEVLDNDKYYYFGKSKEFDHVSPIVTNNKSIQKYSCYRTYLLVKDKFHGKWTLPTMPVGLSNTFDMAKDQIYDEFTQSKFILNYVRRFPSVVLYEPFSQKDLAESSLCRKLNGRKVFAYEMIHEQGDIVLNDKLYDDYAWVTVPELNQYLDEESWKQIRPYCCIY
jgi:hypothetical protein